MNEKYITSNIEFPSNQLRPGLITKGLSLPLSLKDYKLIAFDMDSTLINVECIDEIADFVGLKKEVSTITKAAMRGEIRDYKDSLLQRVSLLKGVTLNQMNQVLMQRVKLNPGALNLVRACQESGLKTLLVSGGFTYFSDHIKELLKLDFSRSNLLEIKDNILTGKMLSQSWGNICDGDEKRTMLLETCAILNIETSQCIAMGDGANDLPMMSIAGLSVAYHAKPTVREKAKIEINQGGLDSLLEVFF